MISDKNFNKEIINKKSALSDVSNEHFEKLAYALKVLETLVENDIPFVFKGGTSLLLLINEMNRLSIDIDILCTKSEKKSIIEKLLSIKTDAFGEIYQQDRKPKPGIDKAHFVFPYSSRIEEKVEESFVLLDVIFEDNYYSITQKRPIYNDLFEFEDPQLSVLLPTIDDLIGDKLVAFAPHTCGIKFTDFFKDERPKHIEIIKQLFDISLLINHMSDVCAVSSTYRRIAQKLIPYTDNVNSVEECLEDTICTCSNIISYGEFGSKNEYNILLDGLKGFNEYVLGKKITNENLVKMSVKVYILATKILHNNAIGKKEIPDATSFFGKHRQQIQLALQDNELYREFRICAYKNALRASKFGTC